MEEAQQQARLHQLNSSVHIGCLAFPSFNGNSPVTVVSQGKVSEM
jgi:hypothetical protein